MTNAGVVLVTTVGEGSMDRYGQLLAPLIDVARLELDIDGASAGLFNVPSLGAQALRGLVGDVAVIRLLRAQPGVPHLAHHHLARYAHALGGPFLLTVHDLIRWFDLTRRGLFINAPNARDRAGLRLDYAAARRATAIIAVSRTTRRDLVRHLRIPPERITVVYEGLDHGLFRPTARRLTDGRYVLFVGSEHPARTWEPSCGPSRPCGPRGATPTCGWSRSAPPAARRRTSARPPWRCCASCG